MNVTAASGIWIASIGLVGMRIGALASGTLTDRFGRRNLLLGSVLTFLLLTALTGFAPGAATIGLLRFLPALARVTIYRPPSPWSPNSPASAAARTPLRG